jgi:hypothetical protein
MRKLYFFMNCPRCKNFNHKKNEMVPLYSIDVLKHLNFSSSFKVHFDSAIPAPLVGVFLHSIPLSSLYEPIPKPHLI